MKRWVVRSTIGLLALAMATAIPVLWTRIAAGGHLYDESDITAAGGPRADVVLVLGAEIAPGGTAPKAFLRGRLDTTAALILNGSAKVVLVSGDADGSSGDEIAVMTRYLVDQGVPATRIVADPYGLDTHDSCVRAKEVYGLDRLLVVTQGYHLARAVALCRSAGIDADGIASRCECGDANLRRNAFRDYFAATKAAWDAVWGRGPAVTSPPSPAITEALNS